VRHSELSEERLATGATVAEAGRAWAAFLRPGDLVVTWGAYYTAMAESDGLTVGELVDLRAGVSQMLRRRVGTIEDCAGSLRAAPAALAADGRGGRRLAALVGLVRTLVNAGAAAGVSGPCPSP
jgi:hypothetical protein